MGNAFRKINAYNRSIKDERYPEAELGKFTENIDAHMIDALIENYP